MSRSLERDWAAAGAPRSKSSHFRWWSAGVFVAQTGCRAWRTRPWRRTRVVPSASSARPLAAPKPTAASAQLKPVSVVTVTIRGCTCLGAGCPGRGCDRYWSAEAQYWWQVARGMCTVRCSPAREGVPGPKRPALALWAARAASASMTARRRTARVACGCMSSPLWWSVSSPRHCSSAVVNRLSGVDWRFRGRLRRGALIA
jgi:hypothetical protein